MQNPVALLIFNRPDVTERVFAEIRKAQPPQLLVVADGPRPDITGETEKCNAARAIVERVDWDCQIYRNYSDINLGCKKRVSSGIHWIFETVETAVILEDDCLPHPSFFRFCDELLERFRDDKRVMMISGTNTLGEWKSDMQSYHFSYFGMIWGWATWRRAWRYYDVEMKLWAEPEMKTRVRDVLGNEEQFQRVKAAFDSIHNGLDTWDFQFVFSRLSQAGLAVIPSVNLISNIGFGENATHTKTPPAEGFSDLKVYGMSFPLKHPLGVGVDREYTGRHNQKFMPGSQPETTEGKLKRIWKILRT